MPPWQGEKGGSVFWFYPLNRTGQVTGSRLNRSKPADLVQSDFKNIGFMLR